MNKIFLSVFFVAAFLFIGCNAFSADSDWLQDFNEAKKKAEKEKLLILADFSGSDWCGWCIKLDKEVFSQKEFKEFAKKNFVLFLADFPSKTKLPPNIEKQNNELAEKYGVDGFPTVIIMDKTGKVLDKTSPGGMNVKEFISYLKKFTPKK